MLRQMLAANPEVTELTAIPDAYVPVMNFSFSGVPVRRRAACRRAPAAFLSDADAREPASTSMMQFDLLMARLALSVIPEDLDLLGMIQSWRQSTVVERVLLTCLLTGRVCCTR